MSLKRIIPAYIGASIVGVGLGLLMAMYWPIDAIVRPIFSIIRPIPPVAWIPLAILWFGINDESKYFLIALATLVSVLQNAYDGAKAADKQLVGVAKMLGANDKMCIRDRDCAISSSFAPMTGAVAAIAEPPQIDEPTPISVEMFAGVFISL